MLNIYRIKGILFSIMSSSGPLFGEPDRVIQMMLLIKTVAKTNNPLFCLSVIYIQKSLKRWKKDFFAITEKISYLNSIYFHAKTILFWDSFFLALSILQERKLQSVVFVNIVFRKFTKWTYEHALTERHAITFREQLINLLYQPAWVILATLSEINMIPLIILNKTQSFITGLKF